jgi:5'-3' exonuclease
VLIALAQSHLGEIQVLREIENRGVAEGFATLCINALEKVLPMDKQTYIKMSIMCFGNDFMPNLAMFSLREEGYARGIHYAYRNDAHKDEKNVLLKRAKDNERRVVAPDGHALEKRFACQLMDGIVDWEPVCYAFWKTNAWTYHYFTTSEVLDWEWYYPYPEAPLLETLEDYDHSTQFTWDAPKPTMTVEDQLRFILPEHSLKAAGLEPVLPDELYDEATENRHPWMKKFAWEADPWVSLPRGKLTTVAEFPLK